MTYRVSEIEVSDADPFARDALERKPVVKFLEGLIEEIDGPFVMALDSPWGSGNMEASGSTCLPESTLLG